ncbi:methyltransferase domain-containing protein [Yoonia sediminilitoris]|uniref:Methyltransferase family protein n=1 Tax=Yoonia sediminilitoris TaxID=1286148 RepID=A0A2T6KH30_9RHOB|nr:methyltransferase domain-containing protein [Yoonia sediminilitoris]PUB14823.1 methyltransferase family protein [Yoonia sediminilitoris]RCW95540.1 methyltransferase family protein [Yoonia sediminilitoris]
MPDPKTIAVYDIKASAYAELAKGDAPDTDLQAFIDLMQRDAHVLDLGCGPASASAYMRAAGLRPDPVDASQGMVTLANDRHAIGARLATFDEISGNAIYDGIWANFSLLHAKRTELPHHLAALAAALKPGGIFHIGMKTGDGSARDRIDRYYTYVTVPELRGLLQDAGLTVIAEREGAAPGLDGTVAPFVIMRARKDQNA